MEKTIFLNFLIIVIFIVAYFYAHPIIFNIFAVILISYYMYDIFIKTKDKKVENTKNDKIEKI